jgi:hypothetical protein
MNENRRMIAEAVVQGLVSEDHLTIAELNETIEMLCDLSIEKGIEEAESQGSIVFYGTYLQTLH